MKILIKFLLICLLFFGVDQAIRLKTQGFLLGKTKADFPPQQEWEMENQPPIDSVIHQPFYFLGSGAQCYAFLSEDKTTVLKLFKHYHLGPSSTFLRKIPSPFFFKKWKENILLKREQRMKSIFSSAKIARFELAEQTGVFHLNVNPTEGKYPQVEIYDTLGICYTIDLNTTPFVLQKRADLLFSYLEVHPEAKKELIDSLFTCISNRSKMGISNRDPLLYRNFGVLEGKVVEIDVGSFVENPYIKSPLFAKKELFYETLELKEWISKYSPDMTPYFEQKLMQAIRT